MIRSAPPASASFADRPGAGAGADDRLARLDLGAQPRERLVPRHRDQLVQAVGHRVGERRVVDVGVELVHLDRRPERLVQPGEQRIVGGRVVERLALDGDHRDALQRHEQHRRPCRGRELAADRAAELGALVRRRAHERHGRVVHVEVAALELRRHRLARAEVDHVERAERDDLRHARRAGRFEPVGRRRRARRRRARPRARSSSCRARPRGSRRARAPRSTARPRPSRGRRAPRSRAPRAARARA